MAWGLPNRIKEVDMCLPQARMRAGAQNSDASWGEVGGGRKLF